MNANNAILHPFAPSDTIHFGKVGNLVVANQWKIKIDKLIAANPGMMEVLFNELYS